MIKNEKGFTLIELIVIIAIIGILATIAVFNFTGITTFAKEKVCRYNTTQYMKDYYNNKQLDNSVTLSQIVEDKICPSGGEYIIDDVNETILCSYHDNDAGSSSDTFKFNNKEISDINDLNVIDSLNDSWDLKEIDGQTVLANGGKKKSRIFFENKNDSYTFDTKVKLVNGKGYGLFFESATDGKGKDTGYIFQFDPGKEKGEIVVKERFNGKSVNLNTLLKLTSSNLEDMGLGSWDKKDETSNWYTEHDISIVVSDQGNGKKEVDILLNGIKLNEKTLSITSANPDESVIGLRSWENNKKTEINIYDMNLEEFND